MCPPATIPVGPAPPAGGAPGAPPPPPPPRRFRWDQGDHKGRPYVPASRVAPTPARGAVIHGPMTRAFKSATTVAYIRAVKTQEWPEFRRRLWQRNDHDHVIRDEAAPNRIRRYVEENPARRALDDENPRNTAS